MIKVNNVSMRFSIANDRLMSLKEYAIAAVSKKLKYKDFWVFKNISFEVEKGDVVGIIGRNGAGKSTLLKIISGVLTPTEGSVEVNGNIVPMLELGSGFDFELTGRENIFLNGSILGYDEEFLKEKYDEIVAFSELGEFIENPIRNYSSGMMMRLAFSIATIVQPEILIVDEILAVGDEAFQKKSKRKMLSLMGGGTTVLFVSHSMGQIREMCNKVAWIEDGKLRMFGETKKVCDAYQEFINPDSKTNLESSRLYWNEVHKFCKDVLYIYGKREFNYYWRVGIGKEQLLSTGMTSGEVYYENLTPELAYQFRTFVFEECTPTPEILDFIKRLHSLHKSILLDMTSSNDIQKDLLLLVKDMINGIIISDKSLEDEYGPYGEIFINPYVASDRIAQLSTWANYDRDDLPNIDPDTIDSEDMLINYNRAVSEKNKRAQDQLRIGCFNVDLADEKYSEFRKKITEYLQLNPKDKFYLYSSKSDERLLGKSSNQAVCYKKIELEDMPRLFSKMNIILNLTENNEYCSINDQYRIIARLVKVRYGRFNISDNTYDMEDDVQAAYEIERKNLPVLSGFKFCRFISSKMTKNYAFLIDSSDTLPCDEILKIANKIYEKGFDVIFLDNAENLQKVDYQMWSAPVVSRSAKYILNKYDNVIATSWKTFEFVKTYPDIKNRYYYIEKYETDSYDDGDFSKFAANQTYFSGNNIILLTHSMKVKTFFRDKYEINIENIEMLLHQEALR